MSASYASDLDESPQPFSGLATMARPLLFAPPTASAALSPSASNSSPFKSRRRHSLGRKRARHNDYNSDSSFPTPRHSASLLPEASSAQLSATISSRTQSPASLTNTRYLLAGGLDTPTATRLDEQERDGMHQQELDYRPNRLSLPPRKGSMTIHPRTPASAAARNGALAGRKRASSRDRPGWGRIMVNIVGGAAGKVFNFCWNTAFRGFQAGEGEAYSMENDTPVLIEHSSWMDLDERNDVFNEKYTSSHNHHVALVPGCFPDDGFISDYMSHPQAHQAQELPDYGSCEEQRTASPRGNWVMVEDPARTMKLAHHQLRSSRKSLQRIDPAKDRLSPSSLVAVPENSSRPSFAGSPGDRHSHTASFASPRGSPRRTRGTVADNRAGRKANRGGSRSSMASPRQANENGPRPSLKAPTSPDVHRFEKKMRRKEKKDDENIQRLNKQLQDMIKEGKQALNTTIEVEDGSDEDEGYGEGSEVMSATKW